MSSVRITSTDPTFAPTKAKDVELPYYQQVSGKPAYRLIVPGDFYGYVYWNPLFSQYEYEFEDLAGSDYAVWRAAGGVISGDYAPVVGNDAVGTATITAIDDIFCHMEFNA